MTRVVMLLFILALWGQPAFGDRVESAFQAGRYMEAAELAAAMGGPDNDARAARALLAGAVASGTPAPERLDEAERLARQALGLEPGHAEARLQLAIALSLKSRAMSTGEALETGYGPLSRDLARSVVDDEPGNTYAHGFLAVWNIEVIRRGGALGAAWMGASLSRARQHYARATGDGDSGPSVHWQYARALAALNARKHRDEIAAALDKAAAARADTALEALMQARARAFRDYIGDHSRREIEQAAARLL